jgi:hypothetical protein
MIRGFALIAVICFLNGCALILSGKSQTLTVESNPPGASCDLFREGRVIATVSATPGAAMVEKTKRDISLVCKKEGYQDTTANLSSGLEGSVFGNILLGGFIGWGVDSAAGADNKYPAVTTVSLLPKLSSASDQKDPVAPPPKAMVAPKNEEMVHRDLAESETATRLRTLEDLKKKGLISESDYSEKRQRIMKEL